MILCRAGIENTVHATRKPESVITKGCDVRASFDSPGRAYGAASHPSLNVNKTVLILFPLSCSGLEELNQKNLELKIHEFHFHNLMYVVVQN